MEAKDLVLKGTLMVAVICSGQALMASSFSIQASNVTLSTSGVGISKFTIASIPATGTVLLSCSYSGTGSAKGLPICPLTPPVEYPVTAGGTLSGQVGFYPWDAPIPADTPAKDAGLAILIVLAAGVRRGRHPWLTKASVILLCAAALSCVTACGGSNSNLGPPGTYPYTIKVVNSPTPGSGSTYSTSTTIQLTIP